MGPGDTLLQGSLQASHNRPTQLLLFRGNVCVCAPPYRRARAGPQVLTSLLSSYESYRLPSLLKRGSGKDPEAGPLRNIVSPHRLQSRRTVTRRRKRPSGRPLQRSDSVTKKRTFRVFPSSLCCLCSRFSEGPEIPQQGLCRSRPPGPALSLPQGVHNTRTYWSHIAIGVDGPWAPRDVT